MSIFPLLLVFIASTLIAFGVASLITRGRRASATTQSEWRGIVHMRRINLVGVVGALVASGVVIAMVGKLGTGMMLAPLIFGIVTVTVSLFGEVTLRREYRRVRGASLSRRTMKNYLPRFPSSAVLVTLLSVVGLVTVGICTASSDYQGRAGRGVSWLTSAGSESKGPCPGSYYASPLLICLAVLLILGVLSARAIVARPGLNADPREAVSDELLRVASMRFTVAAMAIALGGELCGLAAVMFTATGGPGEGAPRWVGVVHTATGLGGLLGLGVLLTGLGSLMTSRMGVGARR